MTLSPGARAVLEVFDARHVRVGQFLPVAALVALTESMGGPDFEKALHELVEGRYVEFNARKTRCRLLKVPQARNEDGRRDMKDPKTTLGHLRRFRRLVRHEEQPWSDAEYVGEPLPPLAELLPSGIPTSGERRALEQEIRQLLPLVHRDLLYAGINCDSSREAAELGSTVFDLYRRLLDERHSATEQARMLPRQPWHSRAFKEIMTVLDTGITELSSDLSSESAPSDARGPAPRPAEGDPGTVFVVHGRDERLRRAMFDFLRAIGLNPLEWSELVAETGSASPYIGQTLDAAFRAARAVVVLLTPDDEACLREDLRKADDPPYESTPTGQARPNVLFEAGMALAAHPDRTVLVQVGTLRPFSDIAGRLVVRLDNSPERRHDVRDRLRSAGCAVKDARRDWLSTGDFEPS